MRKYWEKSEDIKPYRAETCSKGCRVGPSKSERDAKPFLPHQDRGRSGTKWDSTWVGNLEVMGSCRG